MQLLTEVPEDKSFPFASLAVHLGYACGLWYLVLRGFDETEKILKEDTKLEIVVWLLDIRSANPVQSCHSTFPRIFDRVFGMKHLSWKCFWRSSLATMIATLGALVAVEL